MKNERIGEGSQKIGAVVVVVHPDSNKILLGRRRNCYQAGWYGLPGGRIERGEPMITAATRELEEETGLRTNNLTYVGVVREERDGDETFVHFGFTTRRYAGEPTLLEPDKCDGWEWHDSNNLPEKILPGHQGIIAIFVAPKGEGLRDIVPQDE